MADNDLQIVFPESDDVLTCPKCKAANPLESNFCLNCGARLLPPSKSNLKWSWVIFMVACGVGFIYFFYLRVVQFEPQRETPVQISPTDAPVLRKAEDKSPPAAVPVRKDEVVSGNSAAKVKVPIGLVLIKDIGGKIIKEIPSVVVGGGWIALPTRACLGGADWTLKMGPELELSIVGGIYNEYDKISLWRILEDFRIDGPELSAWAADEPLTWLSITSTDMPDAVDLANPVVQGNYSEGKLSGDYDEIGVLMQQNRAVGWTFGDLVAGAFLWNGDEGRFLQIETRVDDFYRITFANSREEEITRAFAMGADYSDVERLEALAGAFRFDPKLTTVDTPAHLQKKTVVDYLNQLVENASKAGFNREVAAIFDAQILIEVGDSQLLLKVVQASAQSFGYEEAIELADNAIEGLPVADGADTQLVAKIFSDLYQNWITALYSEGNLLGAWQAYRLGGQRFPDDPNIHLMGVELALADNNWAQAEEILAMKEYPAALQDKVRNLQSQISDLKAQEGKIVINFAPGSRQIPLTAVLNRNANQKFIVDTGASMVTIPSSTARELGLDVDALSPVRKVFTAGGVQYAPEITLNSITVEGWEVNNVEALVLDIPNQPDWGLLGLNYLQRFRMDVNTLEGVLLLEPR
jgi:clan AA aspartic protease (TIGR02281 family)